jgi:hypothetical protein
MAKKKEEELFKAWVEEAKAKLSDDSKKAFDVLLADEAGAKEVFRGGLREADYYRRLNDLSEAKNAWESERSTIRAKWDEEKPKNERLLKAYNDTVAELDTAKEQLETLGLSEGEVKKVIPAEKSNPNSVTREELDAVKSQLQVFNTVLPKILMDVSDVNKRILKEDWDIEPRAVIEYALSKGVDPNVAFYTLTQDERATRAEANLKKQLDKAREEGKREALTANSPDHIRQTGPSPADFITSFGTRTDARSRVDAAIKGFDSALEASPQ